MQRATPIAAPPTGDVDEPRRRSSANRRRLTDTDLKTVRAALQRELIDQRRRAADLEETIGTLLADADADRVLERELVELMLARTDDAIAEARYAVARITAGTYG